MSSGWGCWLYELDSLTAIGEVVRPVANPGPLAQRMQDVHHRLPC